MSRLNQVREEMRLTKDPAAQRPDRAPGADISRKLQKIIADIHECGHASVTRLTVLKKWFEIPDRVPFFGVSIAKQTLKQVGKATKEAVELLHEASEMLADVDVFDRNIPRNDAISLHARLKSFQNERRELKWTSVRVIHNQSLFLVEGGLRLYIGHCISPAAGYRLAASYCEHYDPRYGSGLNGPSVNRIEEIIGFVRAIEARERPDK
jgi:hypothetical protein